jgi:prepilin-type N-terminal cleavage/methylation domain-containing protein
MNKGSRSWRKKKFRLKAFTLIELLVVISIIGLLSSVSLVVLSKVKVKAQVSRAQQEMRQIMNAMIIARDESKKLMYEISPGQSMTNACTSGCDTACNDFTSVTAGNLSCYTRWSGVIDAVEANSGGLFPNLDLLKTDVWGSPYVIDENEGVVNQQCGEDYIASRGPDRIASGDDLVLRVPFKSLGRIFPRADLGSNPPTFVGNLQCICNAVNNVTGACTPYP